METKTPKQSPDTGPGRNPFVESRLFTPQADVKRPFKMSFEGFAGDGKSFTMAQVVKGIWITEGKKKNVVLVDTERAAKFYAEIFRPVGLIEGVNFFVTASRSLTDFRKVLELCERDDAILMTDTATHLYEEMVKAYLVANERKKVEVWDHAVLKPMWKERFSTPYVNASCHCLFTGRAAWEYAMEENEETKKKDFYKSGVKMRGDNETAFEPDLLVLMQRVEEIRGKEVEVYRTATIMKDRSALLDGKVFTNPTFKDFEPVYKFLCQGKTTRGEVRETNQEAELRTGADRAYWDNRRKAEIFIEEIEGLFRSYLPGQGPKEKKIQADIFYTVFETRSMIALGEMRAETLHEGKKSVEFLLKHLIEKRDWLAKMQDDKTQAFDLAAYIKEAYDNYRAKEDDNIPLFAGSDKGNGKEPEAAAEESLEDQRVFDMVMSALEAAETPAQVDEFFNSYQEKMAGLPADLKEKLTLARDSRKLEMRRKGQARRPARGTL